MPQGTDDTVRNEDSSWMSPIWYLLSLLVVAWRGAWLSPCPSSRLWARVWVRRDCFVAPLGHFTIFFSVRNFKKPSRLCYLCSSFRVSTVWLSSGKAVARFPLWRGQNLPPCCGLVPGTQGAVGWDSGWCGSPSTSSTPTVCEQLC